MKMEHILRAPRDCLIEEVLCNPEQQVQAGDLLINCIAGRRIRHFRKPKVEFYAFFFVI